MFSSLFNNVLSNMFQLPLPVMEKIFRPVVVYLFLIIFLRLFGKRELAQLNPFDLVVLLSLSNTVQNAIIGNDNSVTGGIIGAFALLAINWVLMRLLYRLPKVNEALEGTKTVLIRHGVVDAKALEEETLTEIELLSVIHKQGLNEFAEVETCVLEPNGTFYVEAMKPSMDERHIAALRDAVESLTREVREMRGMLGAR
ncbi:MAG: YetF domain-containing protein [Acidobacteriaceae bacterium]|jgi:uncharacterized membrane protein YcaP (DUF421 family)